MRAPNLRHGVIGRSALMTLSRYGSEKWPRPGHFWWTGGGVSTQVAAIYATSIATAMTAAHYSGFLFPASSLEGMGRMMGSFSAAILSDA